MANKPHLPRSKYNPTTREEAKKRMRIASGSSTTSKPAAKRLRSDQDNGQYTTDINNEETTITGTPMDDWAPGIDASSQPTKEVNERVRVGRENRKQYHKGRKQLTRTFNQAVKHIRLLNSIGFDIIPDAEIESYRKHDKQNLIDIVGKYTLSGEGPDRILCIDIDDFLHHRGGPPIDWANKSITKEDLVKHNFLVLRYGTTYAYRMVDGRRELIFAVRFTPWSCMLKSELRKVRMCGRHFNRTFKLFNPVRGNSAFKKGGSVGRMAAEGWRAGYEKGVDYGAYRHHAFSKKDQLCLKREYAAHTAQMDKISAYFEESFGKLCPASHEQAIHWMEENKMPPYGAVKVDPLCPRRKSSGSNLTVTRGDFSNVFHLDNDASPFAFGIWFLTDSDGELVMDGETTAAAVDGGQFVLPDFKLAIDFGSCAGKVDMMWRGSKDLHATARSTTTKGFQRIGTSIQGARRLLTRVQNSLKKPVHKVNIVDA
ncbi:hypothetical protein BDV93DRAFT_608749 [Ceratobasidium sp. AG-I]|nr:hypothetical protein BDV93DRAFT_608749 [Ceratobasidium sp. AG-I]